MINETTPPSPPRRTIKKGSLLKKIFTRILILLLLALLVIAGLYYYSSQVAPNPLIVDEQSPESIDLTKNFNARSGSFVDNPYFSEPLPFTINLRDRRRFLKVTFYLGMDDPRILPYLDRRMPIVNDIVISTVQYKNVDDLQDILGVERLKSELLAKINNEVFTEAFLKSIGDETKKPIRRILVTEFILQ